MAYYIVYSTDNTIVRNGATWYQALYCVKTSNTPTNSFEISESSYNQWVANISLWHYVNLQNTTQNSAYVLQNESYEYEVEKRKEYIIKEMSEIWSKIQALKNLNASFSEEETRYNLLINQYSVL